MPLITEKNTFMTRMGLIYSHTMKILNCKDCRIRQSIYFTLHTSIISVTSRVSY